MLITAIIFMSLENMTPDESVTKGHEFYEFPLHEMPQTRKAMGLNIN